MYCKTNDNLNLYYEIHGNASAANTIVFLNGLSQSTVAWLLMLPQLKNDYRIVLMDFIFQGQSDKTGEWRTFDTHADDVIAMMNQAGIDKAVVAGISYGSLVAQHMAVNHASRIKKLVLMSTFAHKTPYYEAIELSWWRALEKGGYSLMLDIMLPSVLSENYFLNPLIPIDLMKQARQETNEDSKALFKLMRATKERPDYRPALQRVTSESLVIQGEKDLLFPVHMANEVVKAIPGCRLEIIPNAGHTLNLEAVPQLCAILRAFVG
ncbi:MAG: alpha/beta fold hydrolase [Bacteroidetes bacterium]|nr:alpha/beta fold hydrolase [Bacteroidota bacterium]